MAKLGPNSGLMMNSIWHRKNDQLANVSQSKIGEYFEANHWLSFCNKMLHSQGTLFGLKKFHLAHPTLKGMSHMAFPLPFLDPVVSQEIPKQTYIPFGTTRPVLNHLHKGHRSCCEKSTNPELSHCFLELSSVESPGIRDSFTILGGVTVFNHFKGLPPYVLNPQKRPSLRRIAKFQIFFWTQKGVFHS